MEPRCLARLVSLGARSTDHLMIAGLGLGKDLTQGNCSAHPDRCRSAVREFRSRLSFINRGRNDGERFTAIQAKSAAAGTEQLTIGQLDNPQIETADREILGGWVVVDESFVNFWGVSFIAEKQTSELPT